MKIYMIWVFALTRIESLLLKYDLNHRAICIKQINANQSESLKIIVVELLNLS